jgi:prevent-host-death family protein
MQRIGSRELKNRLGRYLRAVRKGQTLIITDRGKPVAKLAPTNESAPAESVLLEKLNELEVKGLIRLARKPLGKFRPARGRGKPGSQIIIEDRR